MLALWDPFSSALFLLVRKWRTSDISDLPKVSVLVSGEKPWLWVCSFLSWSCLVIPGVVSMVRWEPFTGLPSAYFFISVHAIAVAAAFSPFFHLHPAPPGQWQTNSTRSHLHVDSNEHNTLVNKTGARIHGTDWQLPSDADEIVNVCLEPTGNGWSSQ